jgi:hypothetical protein
MLHPAGKLLQLLFTRSDPQNWFHRRGEHKCIILIVVYCNKCPISVAGSTPGDELLQKVEIAWNVALAVGRAASRHRFRRRSRACHTVSRRGCGAFSSRPITSAASSARRSDRPCAAACALQPICAGTRTRMPCCGLRCWNTLRRRMRLAIKAELPVKRMCCVNDFNYLSRTRRV